MKLSLHSLLVIAFLGTVSLSARTASRKIRAVPEQSPTAQEIPSKKEYPIVVENRRTITVKRIRNQRSATMAKIYRGARLQVTKRGRSKSCPHGWLERRGGGFICSKYLKKVPDKKPAPSPDDVTDLIDGLDAYEVVRRKGPKIYRSLKDIDRHRPFITLENTSTLVVKKQIRHRDKEYFETRMGWYVEDRHLQKLPSPIDTLAVEIPSTSAIPLGIIINENTKVFSSQDATAQPTDALKRWSVVENTHAANDDTKSSKGWVSLGPNRYVQDKDIARYRPAPFPRNLSPDERWLAVDIREQLVHAYEGKRLVRLMPCSTGKRGNTAPGNYRIQWKRRAQTMRLRQGHIRVEDVQWVMYYHRKQGIAIHSAYWHHSFGTPVSHGCVNLPHLDARWVFEWTSPNVLPVDSERFPVPGEPGSRVIVFKN